MPLVQSNELFFDTGLHSYFGFSGGTRRDTECLFLPFSNRLSRYAILREVVENEFADEVPEEKREAFVLKLLPLVGNVFSVYDLSDDNFALSSDYDLLYTELTGATVLYLDEYGV